MNEKQRGRNFEEINKNKILNFGKLSKEQSDLGIKVNWDEARIKCRRCNKLVTVKWKDGAWNISDWKVYLYKAQVKKHDIGYYIVGGVEFYCAECDDWHNWREK